MLLQFRFKAEIAFLAVVLAAAAGCTMSGRSARTRGSSVPADSLYSDIKLDMDAGAFESAEAAARELIGAYPNFPAIDEVYYLAAQASFSRGEYAQAAKYAAVVDEEYALSPLRDESQLLLAESYHELGRFFESADVVLGLLASPIEPELEARCNSALKLLTEQLSLSDIDALVKKYPSSSLAGEMSLSLAKREYARGNYDRAYTLLTELIYKYPEHKRAPEIRHLLKLASARREDPERRAEFVDPYRIGVVMPQTGGASRFGRYFEQGVEMALEEFNAANEIVVGVVKADSKANPIEAVEGVRRLVLEEGVLAIVGSVLSVPSIAAAVESNSWRVPFLAPLASEGRIDEVGPWVFQTKLPSEIEVSAIARVAVEDLMLERFAVLSPDSKKKRQLTAYFVREITSRGGVMVAELYYEVGATDFGPQLDVIREAAPEALFIPGEPEELILVLPQVNFYDMQIQLLGLSNWHSEKLLRLSKRELEGALFPRETYYGKDRESAMNFDALYQERYGGESHPVASAGYFGTRLLLEAVAAGAISREQVRQFLNQRLNAGAAERLAEVNSLSILRVSSGRVGEFRTSLRNR
jgi:branched-chain amino acid transport system substrate-binding protein